MIWAKKRFQVLQRDNFRCQYCGKNGKDVSLEVDHIIPKAKGWTDDFDNLITCCRECNIWKRDEMLSVDVNIWKIKAAEHQSKMFKWFFDRWNELGNGEIERRNITFISWFIKMYYWDFLEWFIKNGAYRHPVTQKEFEEWWEKCENMLEEFDDLAMDDLEYILENLESECHNYSVYRTWVTDDYNERLNWLITYKMTELWFPKSFIYKYSLCPNKVKEWQEEFEEERKKRLS